MIVNTKAVVLKTFPYGDSSLISRCFTQESGKVSFIIKGAKSKKNSKAVYFQPLSYIDIIYNKNKNRDLQIISKVNFSSIWSNITLSLKKITLLQSIIEMTDYVLERDDPNPRLFNILINVINYFENSSVDSNVIFWFYECALLSEMGFAIDINNQDINGLNISKKKGTKSYQILNDILSSDYEKIKNIKYSLKDKNIISEYLFKQLSYHFDGFYKLKSFKVAKKILTKN